MGKIWSREKKATADYEKRTSSRTETLMTATMNFVEYFMLLGDDLLTAQDKVGQMSDECEWRLYSYTLGRTQPLIDCINSSNLPFMDAAAKTELTNSLTI